MAYCPTCKAHFPEGQFCPRDGTHLHADATGGGVDPMVGQVIAERFRILSLLGAGGMGTVYRAEHIYIQKIVALKLLRPEITANPEAITRFQREALAASTIGHDSIVRIDDFGRLPDGQVYLTMEYLDGCPLSDLLKSAPLTLEQVLDVALQTCHGLAAAHGKGIIHRDMKPENIFISRADGQAKILDFGIAKVIRTDENTNLTKTGAVFGTPNYMAPEQALGRRVDHRADIYSMGVILYEMLTCQLPFCSDSFIAILAQHVTEPPKPPRQVAPQREIPVDLETIILRAMAKEVGARFQSMPQMIEALISLRQKIFGDIPMRSNLRLALAPEPATLPEVVDGVAGSPGKVTATAGELLAPAGRGLAPGRRSRLLLGLTTVVVLAAATVGGVVWLRRWPVGEPSQRGASRPALRPDAAPPAVSKKPEPAAPASAPALIEVLVDTEPSGATIERDGAKVGETPESVKVLAGVKVRLRLSREGYEPIPVDVLAHRPEKKIVKLTKIAARVATRASGHAGVQRTVAGKVDRGQIKRGTKRPPTRRGGTADHGDRGDHGSDHGDGEPIDPY